MNICTLCGAAPNVNDGVGDFSWLLAQELSKENTVTLIVPKVDGAADCAKTGRVSIYSVSHGWGIETSKEVFHLVRRLNPDVILVHFVPQLYGWKGAKPFLALLLLALRRRGYRIVTVAHEFSAPFGPSPKLIMLASVHRLLLRAILSASNRIVLTTEFSLDLFRRRFPRRQADFRRIPVASTVPVAAVDEARRGELRRKLGIAADEIVISTFGSVIGLSVPLFEKLFRWFTHEGVPFRILVIGKAGEQLREKLAHDPVTVERIVATGPLGSVAVSEYLSVSDLYVAFYPDGASTRRTSLMIGLAHGIPVVSNSGALTDPRLASSGALHLLNGLMLEDETRVLRQLCKSPELRSRLGKQARVFYEEHCSWQKIGRQYEQVFQEVLAE